MSERGKVEGIVLIYEPVEDYLNQREIVAYRNHRERFIKWLATQGKNPEALEGYAKGTISVLNSCRSPTAIYNKNSSKVFPLNKWARYVGRIPKCLLLLY